MKSRGAREAAWVKGHGSLNSFFDDVAIVFFPILITLALIRIRRAHGRIRAREKVLFRADATTATALETPRVGVGCSSRA